MSGKSEMLHLITEHVEHEQHRAQVVPVGPTPPPVMTCRTMSSRRNRTRFHLVSTSNLCLDVSSGSGNTFMQILLFGQSCVSAGTYAKLTGCMSGAQSG